MDVEELQCFRLCLFLEDYKEDILCGLVWFVSGFDLLGYVGMLMLISFKFVKGMVGGKYCLFLIYVKVVNERGIEEICNGGICFVVRFLFLKYQNNKGYLFVLFLVKVVVGKEKLFNVKNENISGICKFENFWGCDLF